MSLNKCKRWYWNICFTFFKVRCSIGKDIWNKELILWNFFGILYPSIRGYTYSGVNYAKNSVITLATGSFGVPRYTLELINSCCMHSSFSRSFSIPKVNYCNAGTLSVSMSVRRFVCLFVCLSATVLFVCLYVPLFLCLSVCLPVCLALSVCLPVFPSVCLPVCLSIRLSVFCPRAG